MIPRYSRPDMVAVWAPETRFRIWFEIEAHALDAMAELGVVPRDAADAVWARGRFEVERIDAIEAETGHDVIAFLTNDAEHVGEEARFLHQGMTSSDVLDTCLAVQLARASDILLADLDALLAAIKRRAFEHKRTPTIGRSHGIHAEPVTFGLKLALWHAEIARDIERVRRARLTVSVGKLSGAVGTFAHLPPSIEADVCKRLGLEADPVSSQVIQRDRHAELGEEDQRQRPEDQERRSEHDPCRRDHAARRRECDQRAPPGAVVRGLLPDPGHQEDVVVDAEGNQEHEGEQREARVGVGEALVDL